MPVLIIMDNRPKGTFVYRFIKNFEYQIGTYFLPVMLFLEGTEAMYSGQFNSFGLYLAFFYFEIIMLLMKESKQELKKNQVVNLNWTRWLCKVYGLSFTFILLSQMMRGQLVGLALIEWLIPIGMWAKYLILTRVDSQLE